MRVEIIPDIKIVDLTSIQLRHPLSVTLDLYKSTSSEICIELSRTKGDYLGFVDFYILMN